MFKNIQPLDLYLEQVKRNKYTFNQLYDKIISRKYNINIQSSAYVKFIACQSKPSAAL